MYTEFARLWPQVSAPEEYAEEAEQWRETLFDLLQLQPGAPKPRVLELGVGGGNNLSHLTSYVDAVAVDLAPLMLEQSQRLNPGVRHVQGDMRNVRLGEKFDAVLIHDAISYMLTEDDLFRAFATARAHLDPGGILIAGPDWMRGISEIPNISSKLGKAGELSYAEFVYDPDPSDTQIELVFTFFLPQPDGPVKVEVDRHQHGIFPLDTWLRLMRKGGFEAGTRALPVEEGAGTGYLITGVAV
jgi:SAM-dependent methyltransferase